ncbi:hypothetical protein OsJ_23094 [Oryza sativa Japonica Group]|uniref:Uncharacterized protein n=1 Tax=Oryza sativa subsp. japonica TaxID=39947 RepID=B9FVI0_ORYSJ|nr:hypothetical protein OsJ_23094 [Oryza sativa Japonica Group]
MRDWIVSAMDAPAHDGVGEAAPNLVPVLAAPHVALQPRRLVPETVLPVPAAGDGLAGATVAVGDGNGPVAKAVKPTSVQLMADTFAVAQRVCC